MTGVVGHERRRARAPFTAPALRGGAVRSAAAGRAQVREVLRAGRLQARLTVGQPADAYEREAEQVADAVMRMPEPDTADVMGDDEEELRRTPLLGDVAAPGVLQRCGCGGACAACTGAVEEAGGELRRSSSDDGLAGTEAPVEVHEALNAPGAPLDTSVRRFMEPRFGHDFGSVRVHTDARAAESAAAVRARAYTVGNDVVFGAGEYQPGSAEGQRLLAHELTHVVQQGSAGSEVAQRGVVRRRGTRAPVEAVVRRTNGGSSVPESCAPPPTSCTPAPDEPSGVRNDLRFGRDADQLTGAQRLAVAAAAAAWHAGGGAPMVRVDGYASADGPCGPNWALSCRRAESVARELAAPRDGTTGIPAGKIAQYAHGESAAAGPALAPNRRATISFAVPAPAPTPPAPVPTPPPATPACALPVLLGKARGCGTEAPDMKHYDFPSISFASWAKLQAWAQTRNRVSRHLVTDAECGFEMLAVLRALGRTEGARAFMHFVSGGGATMTHEADSSLATAALASGSFATTQTTVKAALERQLAARAAAGATLDACSLTVVPPATHFSLSDGGPLKAVIGGTQGEELYATRFTADAAARTYSIDLKFELCDHFGVDESDLYAPGLFGFWVLQHERSPTLYMPYVNRLVLPVTLSGTF